MKRILTMILTLALCVSFFHASLPIYAEEEELYYLDGNGGTSFLNGEIKERRAYPLMNSLASATKDSKFQKDGTFEAQHGWCKDQACTIEVEKGYKPQANEILYAKWVVGAKLNGNGGAYMEEGYKQTVAIPAGTTVSKFNSQGFVYYDPKTKLKSKTNLFLGWTKDAEGKELVEEGYVVKEGESLYARWGKAVAVRYHFQDSYAKINGEEKNTVEGYLENGIFDAEKSANLYLTLYGKKDTFLGWSTKEDATEEDKDTIIKEGTTFTEAIDVYAIVKKAEVNITYHLPEGTFENGESTYSIHQVGAHYLESEALNLPQGKRVQSWKKIDSDEVFMPGAYVEDDIEVEAILEDIYYLDGNGGIVKRKDKEDLTIQMRSLDEKIYSYDARNFKHDRLDLTFGGWTYDPEGLHMVEEGYSPKMGETLYAKWVDAITIRYHAPNAKFWNGENILETKVPKGKGFISYRLDEMPENQALYGWSRSEEVEDILPSGMPMEESIDVYAVLKDAFVVDGNGAKQAYDERTKVSTVIAPVFNNNSYGFVHEDSGKILAGWCKDQACSAMVEENYVPKVGEVLYANWADAITVRYHGNGAYFWDGTDTYEARIPKGQKFTSYNLDNVVGNRILVGWSFEPYSEEIIDPNTMITDNCDVYAVFKDAFYLDGNGGVLKRDGSTRLKAPVSAVYAKNTYGFENQNEKMIVDTWCKDQACEFVVENGYQPYPGEVLYAKWTDGIRITYHAGEGSFNNGTNIVSSLLAAGDVLADYPTNVPDSKMKLGWSFEENGELIPNDTKIEEDRDVYAIYEDAILLEGNGGHLVNSNSTNTKVSKKSLEESLNQKGFVHDDENLFFVGWMKDVNEGSVISSMEGIEAGSTLYAKWAEAVDVNVYAGLGYFDESVMGSADILHFNTKTITLRLQKDAEVSIPHAPIHKDENYVLVGYSLNEEGTELFQKKSFSENTNIYAIFMHKNDIPVEEKEAIAIVERMYKEALHRDASDEEKQNWINALIEKRINATDLILAFYDGEEMKKATLDDETFIERSYKAILNRDVDEVGKKHWQDLLHNGASKHYILNGLTSSQEFMDFCAKAKIEKGEISLTESRDQDLTITKYVANCYREVLNREFDEDGINQWTTLIYDADNPKEKAKEVLREVFFKSEEFKNRTLGIKDFIRLCYRMCLGREVEESELKYWYHEMGAKERSRDEMVNIFLSTQESEEYFEQYGFVAKEK